MRWVRAFVAFWWDFVVGDDWRVAAGVVIGLSLTGIVSRWTGSSWWILIAVVTASVALSLRRVVISAGES